MLLTACMEPPADTIHEDRLLERWAVAGDRAALESLLGALYAPARSVARRLAGEELADDAVWAGFARVASRARSCRGPVRPWALAVVANAARNLSRDDRRRRVRDRVTDGPPAPAAVPAPEEAVERHERAVTVRAALADLPEHERVPVALVYLDGLDATEAAAVLGRSASTVRSQIQRGLGRLRCLLSGGGMASGGVALPGLVAEAAEAPPVVPAARISAFAQSAPAAVAPAAAGVLAAAAIAGIAATAAAVWVAGRPPSAVHEAGPPAAVARDAPPPPPVIDIGVPDDDGGPLSAGGIFGCRCQPYHDRAVARHGGTIGSEAAVRAGLAWLRRQQRPDGRWQGGATVSDVQLTSQSLLAILASGGDPSSPEVVSGTGWLLRQPEPARNAERGAALMALGEVYGMAAPAEAGTPAAYARQEMRGRLQARVDALLTGRKAWPGGAPRAWSSEGTDGDPDLTATLWCMLGLKVAFANGLQFGDGLSGAKEHLAVAWRAANDGRDGRPDWRTWRPGQAAVMSERCAVDARTYQPGFGRLDQAPAGLLMAVMTGHAWDDPLSESLAAAPLPVMIRGGVVLPGDRIDAQALVWQGAGLFQLGGPRWSVFSTEVRDALVVSQRRGGGMAGSWDGPGEDGRMLATALRCQALSVYVRYAPLFRRPAIVPAPPVRSGVPSTALSLPEPPPAPPSQPAF